MRFHGSKFVLLIFALFVFTASTKADPLPSPSVWKNQRGSVLEVWSVVGGAILGEFINNAPGFECQGIPYPAAGRDTPNGLFFVVTFAKCNSFTRWRGYVRGNQMITNWTLYYIKPNGQPSTINGNDVFLRTN